MKVLFMGTPEFAVKTLSACIEHHEVIGVFTQPDRPSGRGKKLTPPPVKVLAESEGIPVYQPERIKREEWVDKIKALSPDVIVVVAYGQILSEAILDAPKYGSINVHASLLPYYRGAAPINWAIVNGDKISGVTTMQMDVGLDTGDILLKDKIEITEQMTAGELHDHLSEMGAKLLIKTLKGIESNAIVPEPQNHELSTYAPMINKTMAIIDWSESAEVIHNKIRGFNPWPVCFTTLEGKRMKIYASNVVDQVNKQDDIGTVVSITKDAFTVQCGEGQLEVTDIQYGNGKRMPVKAFLLGHAVACGTKLEEA